jgi:hypothetical protein
MRLRCQIHPTNVVFATPPIGYSALMEEVVITTWSPQLKYMET